MSTATLRIDSRLVHGQVIEAWLPALNADSIIVVDEKTAANRLAQAAMRLAIPPDTSLAILGPEEAGAGILEDARRVLILVASVKAAVYLVDKLRPGPSNLLVNVGVMHDSPGRYPIATGLHLSEGEIEMLSGLSSRGLTVEIRGLPTHRALAVEDARARYLKATEKGGSA